MSITAETKDGVTTFTVRVAKTYRGTNLREQKKRKNIPSRAEAEKVERRMQKEVNRRLEERANHVPLWKDLTAKWIEALGQGKTSVKALGDGTIADYSQVVRDNTKNWNAMRVTEINVRDVEALIERLSDEGYSDQTIKRTKNIVGGVFKWAIRTKAVPGLTFAPTTEVRHKIKEDKLPEILSENELRVLFNQAIRLKSPWYPVWLTAFLTGMRTSELYALRWQNVDLEKRLIRVHVQWDRPTRKLVPTKGRYWRVVPINAELYELFNSLRSCDHSGFVLPRLADWSRNEQARALRTFTKGIGITPIRFHTLRACFATALLERNVSFAQIMSICGWKDLKTMERYIRLNGTNVKGATDKLNLTISDGEAVDLLPSTTIS